MTRMIHHIYILPLLISAILSLKTFRLGWPLPYRLFSILLFFVLLVESFSIAWKYYLHNAFSWVYTQNTAWIYNLSFAPQYFLYTILFYYSISYPKFKKSVLVTGLLLCTFILSNQFFGQGLFEVNTISHVFADCTVLFFCFAYFEELKNEEIRDEYNAEIIQFLKKPMAWISFGIFIYHLLNIPYLFGMNYMIKNKISFAVTFHYIYMSFICLMYLCFIKAFLCPTPQQK